MNKIVTKEVTIKDVLEVVTTYGWLEEPEYETPGVRDEEDLQSVSLGGAVIIAVAREILRLPSKVVCHRLGKELLPECGLANYDPWVANYDNLVTEIESRIWSLGCDLVKDFNDDMDNIMPDPELFDGQVRELGFGGIAEFNSTVKRQSEIEALLA